MKSLNVLIILLLGLSIITALSCSSVKSPLEIDNSSIDLPSPSVVSSEDRDVIAIYDAIVDPAAESFTIEPANRYPDYRYPVSNVLSIVGFGFHPNLWVDIRIKHPYPGSGIDGYDPRVIAIIPANPGVSMNYPGLYVFANNKAVLNADGYTRLWDDTSVPGNANPFLAYFKNQPYRVWSSTGVTQDTRRWELEISGFGGPIKYRLIVDVSTHYPNPPQPVIDNAPEPVEINAEIGPGLTSNGGSTVIDVTLLDWQGADGIAGCVVESPSLFDGFVSPSFDCPGQIPNEYIFTGILTNQLHAPAGKYNVLVGTWDRATGIAMYKEFPVTVTNEPAWNPQNVTPPHLNFSPEDVQVVGNYAYMSCLGNGFHIFDVTNPAKPVWLKKVDIPGETWGLYVLGDYAYVCGQYSLNIIDINPPQNATIVKSVSISSTPYDVYVTGGYAYVASGYIGLVIVDVEPINSAAVVKTVDTPGDAWAVQVTGGYAYVADATSGLQVIDVEPIDTAYIYSFEDTPGVSYGVSIIGNYAYVADNFSGLQVVNISNPFYPWIECTVDTPGYAVGVHAVGNLAYVADQDIGLQIIDISTPASSYLRKTVPSAKRVRGVHASAGYAYLANCDQGLVIINCNLPDSATIIGTALTPGNAQDVSIVGDYAFVLDNPKQMQIINVNPPASSKIVKSVDTIGYVAEMKIIGDLAYIADGTGLVIMDINPIDDAHIIGSIALSEIWGVDVDGGYAYLPGGNWGGIYVIDVDPPETPFIAQSLNLDGVSYGIDVDRGYAYIAALETGIQIVDVEPLISIHLVKTVDTPDSALRVQVRGGYAFVADRASGLQIMDIRPPETASIIKTVGIYQQVDDVYLVGGYAYASCEDRGLAVLDIEPPQTASVIWTRDTPGFTHNAFVVNNMAYLADYSGGLQIFSLW